MTFDNLVTCIQFDQIYPEAVRLARDNVPRRGRQLVVAILRAAARSRSGDSHLQKEAESGKIPLRMRGKIADKDAGISRKRVQPAEGGRRAAF